jgi:hypothetical protein
VLRGLDLFSLGHGEERHDLVLRGERMDVVAVAEFGPIRHARAGAFATAAFAGPPTVVARMVNQAPRVAC